ncbi:MAG: hypothetical protein GF364_03490, partial [Candidatus Lokiarchaeota archaeon]|nr:hypothetical protein [Candidatus Lokiarchaeota archaeon]
EHDLGSFGSGITQIQNIGFKKIEVSLQHQRVKDLIKHQIDHGVKCVGMSSFGPTVYSVFESEENLQKILKQIEKEFNDVGFEYYITKANNIGAEITKK